MRVVSLEMHTSNDDELENYSISFSVILFGLYSKCKMALFFVEIHFRLFEVSPNPQIVSQQTVIFCIASSVCPNYDDEVPAMTIAATIMFGKLPFASEVTNVLEHLMSNTFTSTAKFPLHFISID